MSAFIIITIDWEGTQHRISATLKDTDDKPPTVWDVTENLEVLYKSMRAAIEQPYAKAEEAGNA